MATAEHLHAELLDALTTSGELTPDWAGTFAAVPRHLFVPDTIWIWRDDTSALHPLYRSDDPEVWLSHVYADAPVDTQVDDGTPAADGTGHAITSSTSMPTIVAQMLTALDLQPGMRVLEIGTGTGWNAALLAHRVGAANVVTVEIDTAVADQARATLDRVGCREVTVVTGDGEQGAADLGPYDRIIATVGARTVPYPWVEQTRPGGRIVVPLTNAFQPPGVVTIDVDPDGIARGRIGARAEFMGLRGQRLPRPRSQHFGKPADGFSTTEVHPWYWMADRAAMTAIGQCIGDGVRAYYERSGEGVGIQWISDATTQSWAAVDVDDDGGPYPVEQAGPRRLHDEVMVAYRWWVATGSPPVSAWTVTVDPSGQTIDLDTTTDDRGALSVATFRDEYPDRSRELPREMTREHHA